jgi:hypothetical protein
MTATHSNLQTMKNYHPTSRFHKRLATVFAVLGMITAIGTLPFIFLAPVFIPGYILLVYYFEGMGHKGHPFPGWKLWQWTVWYNVALMIGWVAVLWEIEKIFWPAYAYLLPIGAALYAMEREKRFGSEMQKLSKQERQEEVEALDLRVPDFVEL